MTDAKSRLDGILAALAVKSPNALTQAEQLYIAKDLWETLHPAARKGGDRRSRGYRGQDQNEKISFCSVAGEAIGQTARSVQLAVKLAEDLGNALIDALRDTPLAESGAHLRKIADLDEDDRAAVLRYMARERTPFRKALIGAGILKQLDAQEALFRSVEGRLENASARTLHRLRDAIDQEIKKRSRSAKAAA